MATLIICGALAREVLAIVKRHAWDVKIQAVPALHHMHPQKIAPDVERHIRTAQARGERVIVVYGDCGTYGALDRVLEGYGVERVAGPHCYEMYAGPDLDQLMEAEPGTFFLTDFLTRQFEGTVMKGLGLDRYPEMKEDYFGNYERLVYLAQTHDGELHAKAGRIAAYLNLRLEVRYTGYGFLESRLVELMEKEHAENGSVSDSLLAGHSVAGARETGT